MNGRMAGPNSRSALAWHASGSAVEIDGGEHMSPAPFKSIRTGEYPSKEGINLRQFGISHHLRMIRVEA